MGLDLGLGLRMRQDKGSDSTSKSCGNINNRIGGFGGDGRVGGMGERVRKGDGR